MNLRQAIVFSILVNTEKGIMATNPLYAKEKLDACIKLRVPEVLLDSKNLTELQTYANKYSLKWNMLKDLKLSIDHPFNEWGEPYLIKEVN